MNPTEACERLGLSPGASPAELTRAYRRLALRLHPDVTSDPDAGNRFQALTEAYERLLAAAAPPRRGTPVLVRRTMPSERPPLVAGPVHVQPVGQSRREPGHG